VGDRVLQEAAKRLGSDMREGDTTARVHIESAPFVSLRESDTVARIGGDEFIILLSQITEKNDSRVVAARIISKLSRSICIEDREFNLGVSVGISEFPHDGETADILIKNADTAMYKAKTRGGNCYEMFSARSEGGNSDVNIRAKNDHYGEEVKK
jgi:GGDEF domain-containing protein